MNFVAACLYAVSSSTLIALMFAFLHGGLNSGIAAFSLGAGSLMASLSLWRDRHAASKSKAPSRWEWGAIVAFTLITLRIFLWLVFRDGDSIKVLSPNNLGDLSLHLTYIRYLASGVPFWPDNPIFYAGKLTYPAGTDLFNSLLLLVGADPLRRLDLVRRGGQRAARRKRCGNGAADLRSSDSSPTEDSPDLRFSGPISSSISKRTLPGKASRWPCLPPSAACFLRCPPASPCSLAGGRASFTQTTRTAGACLFAVRCCSTAPCRSFICTPSFFYR